MGRRVLFVYNDPAAPEALLGEVFAESGFDIETFEVVGARRLEDPGPPVSFPDPAGYDVVVPLGSRWAVHDERLAWVSGEIAMVRRALDAGAGVLGVCFGGQLLARALGGSVSRSADPEIGWCEVQTGNPAVVPEGPWFQWHFDRFTVPPGARLVAWNSCAPQAFSYGRALGLQFHPELDAPLLERWIAADTDGDIAGLGLDADELRVRTAAELDGAIGRLRLLVAGFLRMLGQQPGHRSDGLR